MKMSDKILKENLIEIDEKILLLTIIGCLEAVKSGGITIAEAEKFLFSPYMAERLREKNCSNSIIQLIEKGCELEDIESLIPKELTSVLDEIKREAIELIKTYGTYDERFWFESE